MADAVVTTLATAGAILSVFSNLPQVYKVWQNPHKCSTDDISPLSTCIHIMSASCWSAYGVYLNLWILAVESFIVFLCYLLILFAIIRDRWFLEK